jgi:hypothetical protein
VSARPIIAAAPVYERLRLTIPAREALLRCEGNAIERDGETPIGCATYSVTLSTPPRPPLVECLIGQRDEQHRGLRCADEPAYPGEWPESVIAWHERGQWVGCPKCGGALIWYEAGYVPGYRLCTAGHHVQLSDDGRSARLVRGRKSRDMVRR